MEEEREDNRFVGTWRLLRWENESAAGSISFPYGRDPRGLLHYAPDGYMFVHIMRRHRPPLSSDALLDGSVSERAAAFSGHVAYAGRWEVRGDRMIHRLEIASVPNWSGGEQHRDFVFLDDNRLELSAPMEFDGRTVLARVRWQRA
ncbi:MAG: lipocalin-like domain-containing protein [Rhodospirillales bacterium]|nr:MAG: lipocalin-like domain-containing protein [Rhodospirillales bacterium]